VIRTAPQNETPALDGARQAHWRTWLMLGALFVLALGVRLYGLGSRSLWADEFCTWHVSRMPLGESLRWGPELTKPPLYQLILRAITSDPHPPEWMLRLPAAIAGILAIPAAFWLGTLAGGKRVGCALAGLLAIQSFHIHHSQDARSYSTLVLGCILSTGLWYRLVVSKKSVDWVLYVVASTLTFHAHYLWVLTLAAHVIWLAFVNVKSDRCFPRSPSSALLAVGVLCVPTVWHYCLYRKMTFQGLDWIQPPTWTSAFAVLARITFGYVWVFAILTPSLLLGITKQSRGKRRASSRDRLPMTPGVKGPIAPNAAQALGVPGFHPAGGSESAIDGLLLTWLACAWFGLLVISWVAHPAMVDRYALPAAIPALLIPLAVAHRLDRRLPMILMIVFSALGLRDWTKTRWEVDPGFRELSKYLAEAVDPANDGVVLTIDRRTHADWDDAERLPFQYYPVNDVPIAELHLAPDGITATNDALGDPRRLYLVVLWAEPFAILRAAGREAELFSIEGEMYTQLLFSPYRLVRVAPLQ